MNFTWPFTSNATRNFERRRRSRGEEAAVLHLRNGRIYRFDSTARRFVSQPSLTIDRDRIADTIDAPTGVGARVADLNGRCVVPAFTDCHVHLAEAGYYEGPRSLAKVRSYDEFAQAVREVPRDGEIVYAGQYDDARWEDRLSADASPLNRYHPDALAMLVRVDSHSTIVNRKTFAWLGLPPQTPGIERDDHGEPTGRLFTDANWAAIATFIARIPEQVRRASERRAAERARAAGITTVHAQLLGRDREGYAHEIESMRALSITVHPKICEPDAGIAASFGLPYIGGDVFLDGSIGSCTAALTHAYEQRDTHGALRFSDDELLVYFAGAEARGIAAGVHAIGDAAIDQCIRVWERVLAGKPSLRGARHFIEHFEMPSKDHVEACAVMGLHLSMQPQFHATWGGEGGMYEDRLGRERRSRMNPLQSLLRAGAIVCGGSDAPVCPLDALQGMRAACSGQERDECLDVHDALALYTVNAARFGYEEATRGNLDPGMEASFVVLDRDPFVDESFERVRVSEVWMHGARVV